MATLSVLALVCGFQFAKSTQQSWEVPHCNAIIEYNNGTLKIDRECKHEYSLYSFLLYPTEGYKTRCQWTNFTQQQFSICESSQTFSQKKTKTIFEHVYNGTYCLAVYHGDWISSIPICNTKIPFYLETTLTELDINRWNPILNIQQYGSNDLFIRIGINHSDGFNFNTFDIEVYNVDEDVTNCDQIAILKNYIKIRVSRKEIILRNLTEGFYCFQVTPVDPRCIHPFSATYLPCTRSSNNTHIIFPPNKSNHTVVVIGAVSTFLFSCMIAIAIFLKIKKNKSNDRKEYEMLTTSLFLLHSNEARHQNNVQMLKKALRERLSSCEIEDYTDDHQWESVAEEGIGWFLSHLNQRGKYIIVIEPNVEESIESDIYFIIGLHQLQILASTADYKRVFVVWFQNNNVESTANNLLQDFGNPFRNFKYPSELDLLIQLIKNFEE